MLNNPSLSFKLSNYSVRVQAYFRLAFSAIVLIWAIYAFAQFRISMLLAIGIALFLVVETAYRLYRYPLVVEIGDGVIKVKSFFVSRSVELSKDSVEFGLNVYPNKPSFKSYKAIKVSFVSGFFGYYFFVGADRRNLEAYLERELDLKPAPDKDIRFD